MAYWDQYEKKRPAKKAVASARKQNNKRNMENICDEALKARAETMTYGQYGAKQYALALKEQEDREQQIRLHKALNLLGHYGRDIGGENRHLIRCTLLYLQGQPHMEAALLRIKRYIRYGDGTGFHDLFLRLAEDDPARIEYAPYICGDKQIGDAFHDFGISFLEFADAAGM